MRQGPPSLDFATPGSATIIDVSRGVFLPTHRRHVAQQLPHHFRLSGAFDRSP